MSISGQLTITTPGIAMQGPFEDGPIFLIKAHPGNIGLISVITETSGSNSGFMLAAGDQIVRVCKDLSGLYFDATLPNQTVAWLKMEGGIDGPIPTYYIDVTNGNDLLGGRTPETAWKTVAKVNTTTFQPGDHILFKRGETWNGESLTVPSSGASGNPITFGAYGTGANPVIDSALRYTDWVAHSGNIWKRTQSGNIVQVFEDGVRLKYAANVGSVTQGSFSHDTDVVYVWCSDNGNPNTDHNVAYAVLATNYGVDINAKSHLIFDSLDCARAKVSGYYFQNSIGSTDVTIRNLAVSYCGERGINAGGTTNLSLSNITVSNVVVHNTLDECVWLGNGSNLIVEDCELYNSGADVNPRTNNYPTSHLPGGIILGIRTAIGIARRNNIHNIYKGAGIYEEFQNTYARPTGVVITRNYIDKTGANAGSGMILEGDGAIVSNNIIINPFDSGIACLDDCINSQILNNTIYVGTDFVRNIELSKCTNVTVKNNSLLHASGTNNGIDIPVAGQTGVSCNYNLFYSNGAFRSRWGATWYTTLATWRVASGQDAQSVEADPVVVAQWTDFHLQVTSPCRNTGVDVGVTDDYDGNSRPLGAAMDIGAYEYVE